VPFDLRFSDQFRQEPDRLCAGVPLRSSIPGFGAAYSDSVPWRRYSNPWRSARPGDNSRTRSNRSGAWIGVFFVHAERDGMLRKFKLSPVTSAALSEAQKAAAPTDTDCTSVVHGVAARPLEILARLRKRVDKRRHSCSSRNKFRTHPRLDSTRSSVPSLTELPAQE
jgi:hypothetical protein